MSLKNALRAVISPDPAADRVVPPSGFTARLTLFSAAAMAALAVFALALSLAAGRLAERWGENLAQASTLRISAPSGQIVEQTNRALAILAQTPGVDSARALTSEEQQALLEPWFGPDLPLDSLPVPRLIEITEEVPGYDATGLRQRLTAEVPGAVLDDHQRWRQPLLASARGMRYLAFGLLVLVGATLAAIVTLATRASLAASGSVIEVLRSVGATDDYIAHAFVRRYTVRSLTGAVAGAAVAASVLLVLPKGGEASVLTGIAPTGAQWLLLVLVPALAGATGFVATWTAARRVLGDLP
ncbi:MAG: cell division protein FtsX [Primorskyibacter sp.]